MKTLKDTLAHFSRVFGRRNCLCFPSAERRIALLLNAVDNVQDGVRKGAPKRQLSAALAHVAACTFLCADGYGETLFVDTLAAKYPVSKCIYCGKRPCGCTERRKRHTLSAPNATQCSWSLKKWCDSFNATYGKKNKERGVYYCIARLFGEVAELEAVQLSAMRQGDSLDKREREIVLELADVFAWTVAVANMLDINLEAAIVQRYAKGCDVCKKKVCECTHLVSGRTSWQTI